MHKRETSALAECGKGRREKKKKGAFTTRPRATKEEREGRKEGRKEGGSSTRKC